jgi:hypothetical protein
VKEVEAEIYSKVGTDADEGADVGSKVELN